MKQNKSDQKAPEPPAKTPLPVAETAEQILLVKDLEPEPVEVPEWGYSVLVKRQDAKTALDIMASCQDEKGKENFYETVKKTLFLGIIKPKFSPGQLEALMGKSDPAVTRIFNAIKGKKKGPSNS